MALLGWESDAGPARPGDPGPAIAAVIRHREPEQKAYLGGGWTEAVALARTLDHALADAAGTPVPH